MQSLIESVEAKYRKKQIVDVRSGDTVRVHQKVKEGNKERVQVFEGLVIRTRRTSSLSASVTVRRIASGVGVEKSFLLHSPLVQKIEVVKRSKVRRKYLSYMRERGGKSARLSSVKFDKESVNKANELAIPADETKEAKAASEHLKEDKPAEAKVEKTVETDEQPAKDSEAKSKEDKTEEKAESKVADKQEKAEPKESKEDKAQAKKAKAEEFRKKQDGK